VECSGRFEGCHLAFRVGAGEDEARDAARLVRYGLV